MKNWKKYLMTAMVGAAAAQTTSAIEINEKLELNGDLRFRHEWIDQDDKDTRNRWRIRVRAGLKAEVNEEVKAEIRLATGGGDPVFRNTTLDGGFSDKDIRLDKAYITWTPEALGGTKLQAGKMSVPFVKIKDLIWDGDLAPEGIAVKKELKGDSAGLKFAAGAFAAEERSSDDDSWLLGAQAVANIAVAENADFEAGAGVFHWDNMEGFPVLADDTDGFGNDTVAVLDELGEETGSLLYANEFTEVEVLAKLKIDAGVPVTIYADVVFNTEADEADTGYMFGATVGKAKAPGSAQLDYNFRELEANAVVGAYSDSDSGGGGTGIEGHKIQGKYQISDSWQFSASLFLNELTDGTDYNRAQIDVIAKF